MLFKEGIITSGNHVIKEFLFRNCGARDVFTIGILWCITGCITFKNNPIPRKCLTLLEMPASVMVISSGYAPQGKQPVDIYRRYVTI
jgi:hypothetical protein